MDDDGERLVLVHEVALRAKHLDCNAVMTEIRPVMAKQHGVQVYAILLIKAGSLPKTSRGRVQRSLCRVKLWNETSEMIGQTVAKVVGKSRGKRRNSEATSKAA